MTAQTAEPLPECNGANCGRPTRRAVWQSTGGYCTACAAWAGAVRVVGEDQAAAEVDQLREWQQTVHRIRRAEALEAAERAQRRRARQRLARRR